MVATSLTSSALASIANALGGRSLPADHDGSFELDMSLTVLDDEDGLVALGNAVAAGVVTTLRMRRVRTKAGAIGRFLARLADVELGSIAAAAVTKAATLDGKDPSSSETQHAARLAMRPYVLGRLALAFEDEAEARATLPLLLPLLSRSNGIGALEVRIVGRVDEEACCCLCARRTFVSLTLLDQLRWSWRHCAACSGGHWSSDWLPAADERTH